jgi:transposase
LLLFVEDPRIALDNNLSERMLRTIAIGRKNFLFVGDDDAGEHLAVLQSLVATCDLHGVNPTEYIADVLIRIQTHPANQIGELLPHRWMDLIERERVA